MIISPDAFRPESFRPDWESCEVVSPGVWKSFRPDWESTLILMFVGAFFRMRNIHTTFSPVYLFQTPLDRSEISLELDLFLFILRSSRKRLGRNDFHTPGESTLSPGEMTSGKQVIGWNDLLPRNDIAFSVPLEKHALEQGKYICLSVTHE